MQVGYRDQNEATFASYNQNEYLVELGHTWRPWQDQRTLTGTIYAKARRAELHHFSYDEIGVRMSARQPVNDSSYYIGRLSAFRRDYGWDHASPRRADRHIKATIGIVKVGIATTRLSQIVPTKSQLAG